LDRTIDAITKIPKINYGHIFDLIFRQHHNKFKVPIKFGVTDAGPKDGDNSDNKHLFEEF
jgi:hypothetical protein